MKGNGQPPSEMKVEAEKLLDVLESPLATPARKCEIATALMQANPDPFLITAKILLMALINKKDQSA